jgi:hypothetical protein
MRLVVPVSDAARWNRASVLLQRMMNFLTGDRWTFDFRPRPEGFEQFVAARPLLVPELKFDGVSLFSGGLDSLIGAIDALEGGRNPLFVSHAGEGAVSAAQEKLFRRLEAQYPNRPFRRLRVWMSFDKKLVKDVSAEDSNRTTSPPRSPRRAKAGSRPYLAVRFCRWNRKQRGDLHLQIRETLVSMTISVKHEQAAHTPVPPCNVL